MAEENPVTDVTRLLNAIESGDQLATEQLLPLVYDELKRIAVSKLAKDRSGKLEAWEAPDLGAIIAKIGGKK